jgi:hypothetical protein
LIGIQVALCYMWDMAEYGSQMEDLPQAGEYVYRWYREQGLLPENPAGFSLTRAAPDPNRKEREQGLLPGNPAGTSRTMAAPDPNPKEREQGLLPGNPARFNRTGTAGDLDPKEGKTGRIRVLVESREGPFRNLLNVKELVRACNEDPVGDWECREYRMGAGVARWVPHSAGSLDPLAPQTCRTFC